MWADKSKGSKVKMVEKSPAKRLHGAGTLRAPVGFVLHSRALGLLWRCGSPAVMRFHVKPRELRQVVHCDNLVWSNPGAVNDYDHCGVLSFLASHKPHGEMSQV